MTGRALGLEILESRTVLSTLSALPVALAELPQGLGGQAAIAVNLAGPGMDHAAEQALEMKFQGLKLGVFSEGGPPGLVHFPGQGKFDFPPGLANKLNRTEDSLNHPSARPVLSITLDFDGDKARKETTVKEPKPDKEPKAVRSTRGNQETASQTAPVLYGPEQDYTPKASAKGIASNGQASQASQASLNQGKGIITRTAAFGALPPFEETDHHPALALDSSPRVMALENQATRDLESASSLSENRPLLDVPVEVLVSLPSPTARPPLSPRDGIILPDLDTHTGLLHLDLTAAREDGLADVAGNLGGLDQAIQQFLGDLDALIQDLGRTLAEPAAWAWLLAAGAGAGAFRVVRQKTRQREALPNVVPSWVPGLPPLSDQQA